MKKRIKINFLITGGLFALFILLLVAVLTIDIKPIGPENSSIGLATLNNAVFKALGVNMIMYHITDWLGVVAIAVALGFAVVGLVQLIKRKSIKKVDPSILLLGGFYVLAVMFYILFEFAVINYRPVILGESLESSFPSSTTLTTVSIMGSAMILFSRYFKNNKPLLITVNSVSGILIVFTVIGRQISGVHWFTDILGGILLSIFLIMLYYSFVKLVEYKQSLKK